MFKHIPTGVELTRTDAVIVDVPSVMRNYYKPNIATRSLSYTVQGEEINTTALYGLFQLFKRYGKHATYYFCFDTPYTRNATDDYLKQVELAREILTQCRFITVEVKGLSASDVMHLAVNDAKQSHKQVYMLTHNQDLACRINETTHWVHPLQKKEDIGMDNYEAMLGCPYNTVLLKKAIVGGTVNKSLSKVKQVTGVSGIGAKGFYKLLTTCTYPLNTIDGQEYTTLQQLALSPQQLEEARTSLVEVYPSVPQGVVINRSQSIDIRAFQSHLIRHGMQSILKVWGWDL